MDNGVRYHFSISTRAAELGLEPRYTASEAIVLPLDDSAALVKIIITIPQKRLFYKKKGASVRGK